jgi:CheY-like chemotaxis protein
MPAESIRRIMIVDDDPMTLRVLTRALRGPNVTIAPVRCGQDALAKVEHADPEILLTDLKMPGTDGLTLIREVRRRIPEISCLLMTGFGGADVDAEAAALGVRVMLKPLDPFAVRTAVYANLRPVTHEPGVDDHAGNEERASMSPRLIDSALIVSSRVALRLARVFPDLGYDRCVDAANDIVLQLLLRRMDASEIGADAMYRMAWRRARDLIIGERARKRREARWAMEARAQQDGIDYEACRRLNRVCDVVLGQLPDDDSRITFLLWLQGERRTDRYAVALGLERIRGTEATATVKRQKDRVKKLIARSERIRDAARILKPH